VDEAEHANITSQRWWCKVMTQESGFSLMPSSCRIFTDAKFLQKATLQTVDSILM
jgi:hypothetical protein